MTYPRLITLALVSLFIAAPQALADELTIPENAVRAEVIAGLPDWWQVEAFEMLEADEASTAPPGKVPAPVPAENGPNDGAKPGMVSGAHQAVAFSATLRLTEQIYEPLYALDGTAMVREIMDAGHVVHVTGSIAVTGEGDVLEFSALRLRQAGVEALGRPLSAFDLPALVQGSAEADAFFADRDQVRAEGTMNKLMGDAGEEL